MNLHYLEIFSAVAEFESVTKASALLHISQSALSIQLKNFENELGVKLFDRTGNRISLNKNGKALFEYSKKIFNLAKKAEYELSHHSEFLTGTILIGASAAPGTYILPPIVAKYKKLYPGVNIILNLGTAPEIAHYINSGSIELAVIGGNPIYHKGITAEKLFEENMVLVASPESEYANRKQISLCDIKSMSFVVHKTDSQMYSYYRSFIDSLDIKEKVSLTVSNIDAIKKYVAPDMGVALLPYSSVSYELNSGLLKALPFEALRVKYPYSLVYNVNRYLSPPLEKFIETLRESINEAALQNSR